MWHGFLHAVASVAYVAFIAYSISNVQALFGPNAALPPYVAILFFLLTFVISAAIMAILVFGRPVILYFDGRKREAIMLALYTIGFIVLIALVMLAGVLTALSFAPVNA